MLLYRVCGALVYIIKGLQKGIFFICLKPSSAIRINSCFFGSEYRGCGGLEARNKTNGS